MKTARRSRSSQRGFSLIELMVTILILGLLYGSLSPAVDGTVRRAKNSALRGTAHTVQTIVEGYKLNTNGEVPTTRAQMCTSPSWTDVSNPYNKALKGMNSRLGGAAGCPGSEIANMQAPIFIAPHFQVNWGTNPIVVGTVWYIPYQVQNGNCTTSFGAADNCMGQYSNGQAGAGGWGGGTMLSGNFEYYRIMAVGQNDYNPGIYTQVSNLILQNF